MKWILDLWVSAALVLAALQLSCSDEDTPAVPDTTAPAVEIVSPADGDTLDGDTTIQVDAADDVGVRRVLFYVDGTEIGTDSEPPWELFWQLTLPLGDATYSLTAAAIDAAGNEATSPAVHVHTISATDTIPPTVAIVSPAEGDTLTGDTTIQVEASDNVGVLQVTFFVDGEEIGVDGEAPYEMLWPLPLPVDDEPHVLTATAVDAADNAATSSAVQVRTLWQGDIDLGALLAAAGPREYRGHRFDHYAELNPAYTYLVPGQLRITADTCIRGNSATIDMQRKGDIRVEPGAGDTTTRLDIEYCLILRGQTQPSTPFGGALFYAHNTRGWVKNNTFWDCFPAAVYIDSGITPDLDPDMRVINNIFYANLQGILYHVDRLFVDIHYNAATGGDLAFGTHCGCPSTHIGEPIPPENLYFDFLTNLVEDPRFVEIPNPPKTEGDFHLRADSPCRGRGENGEDLGAFPYEGRVQP